MTEPQIVPAVPETELAKAEDALKGVAADVKKSEPEVKKDAGIVAGFAKAVNGNKALLSAVASGFAASFGLHLTVTDVVYVVSAVAAVATWIEKV